MPVSYGPQANLSAYHQSVSQAPTAQAAGVC
jgi:hypothetical protein